MNNETAGSAKQSLDTENPAIDNILREILSDLLGLTRAQVAAMTDTTALFGAIPELDSLAVAGLLTEMEDRLNIQINDEDIDAELFESFGSLLQFAKKKLDD